MRKFLFFVSFMAFAGCSSYTVKNELEVKIKVGDREVQAGECAEFSDSFFGLFGDFPVAITKEDETDLSEEAPADQEWDANNYVVGADGSVTEAAEQCELTPAEEAEEDTAEEDGEAEEEDKADEQDKTAPVSSNPLEDRLGASAPPPIRGRVGAPSGRAGTPPDGGTGTTGADGEDGADDGDEADSGT